MKVKNITPAKKGFQPLTIQLTIETEQEAKALRILHGGIDLQIATIIYKNAVFFREKLKPDDINEVLEPLAKIIEAHLINCGINN